jgi:hypothetical protein
MYGPLMCGGPCSAEPVRTLVNPVLTPFVQQNCQSPLVPIPQTGKIISIIRNLHDE